MMLHGALSCWGVRQHRFRIGKAADILPTRPVPGRAETNLFVGPLVADENSNLALLGPAADCCSGETFVALVPHPDQWQSAGAIDIHLWQRTRMRPRSLSFDCDCRRNQLPCCPRLLAVRRKEMLGVRAARTTSW